MATEGIEHPHAGVTSVADIPFIVEVSPTVDTDTKGFGDVVERTTALVRIPAETLKRNLSETSGAVLEALQSLQAVGEYRLKKVVLQVEISAEGGVSFVGTAKAGAKGAVTLEFEAP